MKTLGLRRTVFLMIMIMFGMRVSAQQLNAEVPGDNFSLEGALELFKKSASPEEFEKSLNSPDEKVNNLDLNGDGYIDYIRVIDKNEGNVHAFILQAVISENESQDVAVITLEKLADGKAVLQITGDADIYGIETIIEPTEEVRINAGATTTRRVVNVWTWPSVQYIYSPYYTNVWISPWHYSYHPVWYRPWRPVAYHVYSPWWRPYRSYYTVCYTHRVTYAHQLYRPYRTTSVIVYNRHNDRIRTYRSTRHDYDRNGHYKYADNRKRTTRSDNSYNGSRSNGRQYDTRNNATMDRRQIDSRRTYSGNTSRSTTERNSQEQARSTETKKREYSGNTPATRRSETTPVNRSTQQSKVTRPTTPQPERRPTVQRSSEPEQRPTVQRSNVPERKQPAVQRSNAPARQYTDPGTRSNSRSQQPTTRPAPSVERKSSSPPSRQSSGENKSQQRSSSERSKRGGQ